ncbi:hypothetical protein [Streptomyces inhibens]|uniref:hypothetical protein n=1 Tax=Streptomyces inhibens TaxID=2293571 RepID=UPI001EE74E9E|nr:hypothetical protein [Streptomyces inhibens]UKY47788.1 hypothetical protein KI385_02345 [Streptomyces inhibens]
MRERDLGTAAASVLAWAGAAAFLICLLVRKIAPYPRWDLLACLAFSAVAFLAWWLRATGRWRSRLGRVVPAALGLEMGRQWWPPLRLVYTTVAACALLVPFFLLSFSTEQNSPQLAAITQRDYRYAPVTITKIHHTHQNSSKTGTTYTSVVTVEAPGDGKHGKALRLKGKTTAYGRLTTGDRIGGLYAPDVPSLGIILTPRRHLASLLGGPASPGEMTLLAIYSAIPIGLFLICAKPRAKPMTPESVLGGTPGRRLRVHIAGANAGQRLTSPDPKKDSRDPDIRLSPALRLSSSEGCRDLFIDRCLDPHALAGALEGRAGWLYWAPKAEHPPDWCVAALLVLDDDRYVCGLTPQGSADLPEGASVDLPLPDARPLRAVGPYALWQPAVHGPGMCGFGLGFLAVCLIVAGVDYDGGPLLSMCFITAVGGPMTGLLLIHRRRTAYLRRLARGPDEADERAPAHDNHGKQ